MSNVPLSVLVLLLLAVALLFLVQWTFVRLGRTDAPLYDELGRPNLFVNNNVPNVIAFWKWVYGRSVHYIGDTGVSLALWVIRIGTVIYGVALVVVAVLHLH